MISMLAFLSIFDRRRTKVSSLAIVCPSRSVVAYINGTHIDRPQGCAQITGARTNQRGLHRSWPRAQSIAAHTSQECAQVTGARTDYHDCVCFASASALHDCSRVLYINQLCLPALLCICCFITACITPLRASQPMFVLCIRLLHTRCFASACITPTVTHLLLVFTSVALHLLLLRRQLEQQQIGFTQPSKPPTPSMP